ncbi:MAG: UvrD-helicase domain-containing protein [Clostridiales Family XIII bacterium]|jgi:ATP-dependent helicase/nuclease subunit A|nr:UvrD-helicase domain-containing protein [Clostridiales Family XIII bacterium]
MAEVKFTTEQQQVIDARGSNILVSAAAGSGKTATMIERIKQLIIKDHVDVTDMLIVTFTDAAASEMKRKLVSSIKKTIADMNLSTLGSSVDKDASDIDTSSVSNQSEQLDFLKKQLMVMGSAQISTFHSFAFTIYKENYQVLGKEPRFTVIDDFRAKLLQAEAMDETLAEFFDENDEDFLDFCARYTKIKNEDAIRTMISNTYDMVIAMPEPFAWLEEKIDIVRQLKNHLDTALATENYQILNDDLIYNALKEFVISEIGAAIAILKTMGEYISEHGVDSIYEKNLLNIQGLSQILENIEHAQNIEDFQFAFDALSDDVRFKFQVFRAKKIDNEEWQIIKPEADILHNNAKSKIKKLYQSFLVRPIWVMLDEQAKTLSDLLVLQSLVERYHEKYDALKIDADVVDFSDFEHLALAVLDHDEVSDAYKKRYQYIFVDEYQDSNYIQETFIGKVSRGDNVFMVGDVKQSIYSFRGAVPDIFVGKYNSFDVYGLDKLDANVTKNVTKSADTPSPANSSDAKTVQNGLRIDLNKNFRSRPHILESINGLFYHIMEEKLSGIVYDDAAALYPARESSLDEEAFGDDNKATLIVAPMQFSTEDTPEIYEKLGQGPDVVAAPDNEVSEPVSLIDIKKTEAEAIAIAQKIHELKAGTYTDDAGNLARYSYRDMVILLRTYKTPGKLLSDALTKLGIPTYVDAGESIFDKLEIHLCIAILTTLVNIHDDVALATMLLSPLCNLTIDDLIEIRVAHPDGDLATAFLACAQSTNDNRLKDTTNDRTSNIDIENNNNITANIRDICIQALELIHNLRAQTSFMELADFVHHLVSDYGIYDYVATLPQGALRLANLRAFTDMASSYKTAGAVTLRSFVSYIKTIEASKISAVESMLIDDSDDVVRIISVHKSKGLEYPIVFMPFITKEYRAVKVTPGALSIDKHEGLALDYVDLDQGIKSKTILRTLIDHHNRQNELAEEIRILYVGLTRAREKLFLVTAADEKMLDTIQGKDLFMVAEDLSLSKSNFDYILPFISDAKLNVQMSQATPTMIAMLDEEMLDDKMDLMTELSEIFNHTDVHDGMEPFAMYQDAMQSSAMSQHIGNHDTNLQSEVEQLAIRHDAMQSSEMPQHIGNHDTDVLTDMEQLTTEIRRRFNFVYPHKAAISMSYKYSVSSLVKQGVYIENQRLVSPIGLDASARISEQSIVSSDNTATPEQIIPIRAQSTVSNDNTATSEYSMNTEDDFYDDTRDNDDEIFDSVDNSADNKNMNINAVDSESTLDLMKQAALKGTAFHECVYQLDFKEAVTQKDNRTYFEALLKDFAARELLSEDEANLVDIDELMTFARSELIQRVIAAGNIEKEVPWVLKVDKDGEDVMIQGIIDAYFEESDDIVLYDYKTNRSYGSLEKDTAHMRALYAGQLDYYAQAIQLITGKTVKERMIYMTKTGAVIQMR